MPPIAEGVLTDLEMVLPPLVAVLTACVVLVLGLFRREAEEQQTAGLLVAVGGCLVALLTLYQMLGRTGVGFAGEIRVDHFGVWTGMLAATATLLALLGTMGFVGRYGSGWGEALALVLFTLAGILLVCLAGGLLALFLGIEILSISAYALTALTRFRGKAVEGALRYFILGGVASAFLLMGVAFAYGATGTSVLAELRPFADAGPLPLLALTFFLVGLGFKIGAVPFHAWVPDAYEGAPTPMSAFMASAVKVGGFGALMRILATTLADGYLPHWQAALGAVAALTMIFGNLVALVQSNLKRMLAYSSIAHTGYMLLGVIAAQGGAEAVLFYLAAYVPTVLGAFMILVAAGRDDEDLEEIESLRGLARRHPLLALAMTVFMLSFIGIPGTAGFVAKLGVFAAALKSGYTLLAVLGILTSIVSVAYYLNVIRVMYIPPAQRTWYHGEGRYGLRVVLAAAVVLVILLGIWPGGFLSGAGGAARALLAAAP